MAEAELKQRILRYLKTIPGLHAFRVEPSPRSAMRGVSDILICYQGQFVAMEVKHGRRERAETENCRYGLQAHSLSQ